MKKKKEIIKKYTHSTKFKMKSRGAKILSSKHFFSRKRKKLIPKIHISHFELKLPEIMSDRFRTIFFV